MEPGEGLKPVGMSDARKRSTIPRKIAQEPGAQWPVAGAVPRRVSTASGISHRQKEKLMSAQPFTIQIDDDVLSDLQQRLQRTRWPDEIAGAGWDYGTNLDYLKQLVAYWRDAYDWRAQERLLNRFPQFQATIDGFGLHFLHIKGQGPRPLPLLISHGWPGSFFEMYKIIGPLSDPISHGGSEQDAFDVVVPSLPGYGFSERPRARGMNVARIAELFLHLMRDELGYQRFGAQGGDWGSSITSRLGYAYPQHLIGIHLNMISPGWAPQESDSLGDSPEV